MPRKLGKVEQSAMEKIRYNIAFAKVAHKVARWIDQSEYKPKDKKINQSALIVGSMIYVYVSDLDELHLVRGQLKAMFPDYSDELESIYPKYWPDNYGEASWKTSLECVTICLNAPMEGFPVELKPGCGFKQVERQIPAKEASTQKSWEYSCQK